MGPTKSRLVGCFRNDVAFQAEYASDFGFCRVRKLEGKEEEGENDPRIKTTTTITTTTTTTTTTQGFCNAIFVPSFSRIRLTSS